ncbi:hypothetical protein B7P43_G13504 [Cryptotermes secundus]|uniref:Gustatory receptor n=1 Tax=Cryptotermes secundus TaxID=105785 RepID=A0A2J7PYS3_9NEOP|nr:hypothetical protein B7P43_G13504 [Cryptotermes secundus]
MPLKPLFYISRAFCLTHTQTFNKEKNEDRKTRFQHITLVCLWNIVLLIGMVHSMYFACYNYNEYPDKVKTTLIVYYVTLHCTTIVTSITSSVNRKKIPGILQRLMDIDKLTEYKEMAEVYRKTKREVVIQITTLFLTILIATALEFYCFSDLTLTFILSHTLEFITRISNIIMVLLYINIVRLVRHRYLNIFESLAEYVEVMDMSAVKYTNCFIILHRGRWELPTTKRSSIQLLPGQSKQLQTLRLLYIEMYDTVQMITSHFGVPILCHILSVMVTCVLMFYSAFHFIHSAITNSEGVTTYIMSCYLIFYGIMYVTPFVWLVISCGDTAQDANRAVIHIHRAIASPYPGNDVITELEKLSNQLKDMKVEFSVCGLFVLNLPFLCTFVGGIFTYIIIMVQLN